MSEDVFVDPEARSEVDALQARVDHLEQLVLEMRSAHEEPTPAQPVTQPGATHRDTIAAERPTTRRNLMRAAGAAGAGIVAGSLMQPKPAAAASNILGVQNNVGNGNETEIRMTSNADTGSNIFLAQSTAYASGSRTAAVSGWAGTRNIFNGVYGYTEGRSASANTGHGVVAFGGTGSRSDLYLVPFNQSPKNDNFNHTPGEIRCDFGGNLWYCTGSGTPGTWKKLSGPSAAGAFHLLASPRRAYDSRISQGGSGPVTGGTSQAVNVQVSGVPNGFTGVLCNLTIVTPAAAGFATLYSNAVSQPATSSVNFTAGAIVGNNATTAVSGSGNARIFSSATADYVIDVMGFFE